MTKGYNQNMGLMKTKHGGTEETIKEINKETELTQSEERVLGETKKIISDKKLELIRGLLSHDYGELLMAAMINEKSANKLKEMVKKQYHAQFNKAFTPDENAEYIVNEMVGTGIIERLIRDDDTITDIEWDGDHLAILSNDEIIIMDGKDLNIDDDYINRLIQKFVAVNKTEFNRNQALFNGMYGNMRMSATHTETSPYGITFSLRVSKSRLALNESNWLNFAPQFVLDWLSTVIRARANIVIAGETGAGKTELQKFLLGFAAPTEKFYLIEDVQESHLKELYPNRRLFSTLTTPKYSISDHVKHALRNNPEWIIVAETRGEEAYEMLQAILSSHNIITTVHATDARAIPHRFMNMCLSGGSSASEKMLEDDIYRYFDLGMHIKRTTHNGKTIRYLSEVVEYNADGTATTLFHQVFRNGQLQVRTVGTFSAGIHDRLAEKGLSLIDGDAMAAQAKSEGVVFESFETETITRKSKARSALLESNESESVDDYELDDNAASIKLADIKSKVRHSIMNPVTHDRTVVAADKVDTPLPDVPSQSEILRKLRKKNLLTKGGK